MVQVRIARTVLSHALSLALLGVAGMAQAQEPPQGQAVPNAQATSQGQDTGQAQQADPKQAAKSAKQLATVNVTGSYRSSIQFSTDAKRDATGFTDTIFAEDIGKFPDTNIAESLARIPGVQLNRDVNGEGLNIAIRGLGSSFTKTTINGNSVATASIGLDATNQNREVDLNIFPTEFFSQLTVYKSPKASLPEGGAAGVVDMRNAHAFDNPGTHLTYSLQAADNSIDHKIAPQGSVIGSWTNDAGTFGALFGLSSVRGKMAVDSWEDGNGGWIDPGLTPAQCGTDCGRNPSSNRWRIPDAVPNNTATVGAGLTPGQTIDAAWLRAHNPGLSTGQIGDALVPYLPRPVSMRGDRDRDALLGSLEWRPSQDAHFWVDYLYTKAKRTNNRIDMDLVARNNNADGMIPLGMKVDSNGVVTNATLTNAQFFLEARPYHEKVNYWQVDPGATFWFGDDGDVRLDLQAGTSRSWMRRDSPTILVTSPFTTVNYSNTDGMPVISSDLDLNDPNLGWSLANGGRVNVQNEHRLTKTSDFRADLQLGGDDKNNVKVGVAWDSDYRKIQGFDNSAAWQSYVLSQIPDSALSQYLRPGPGFITADFNAFMDATNYAYYRDTAPEGGSTNNTAQTGSFSEDNRAAYVEFNTANDVWGRELRINAGVRYAATNQWISGPVTLGGVRQWQTLSSSYSKWLPSFSAAWSVAPSVVLRLSGSKTMTRPNPSAMLPATTFTGVGADSARQGNPNLAPYTSTNFDLGGEWYTGNEGYVGLTFFNKRVEGYTFNGQSHLTLSQLGVPYDALNDTQKSQVDANGGYDNFLVDVSQQVNADAELNVRGWEATWVQPLDFALKGLGFMANYTKLDLTTEGHDASALAGNIYGVSPKMWNATLYWEDFGASVRLSYNWQEGAKGSSTNQNSIPFAYYYGADRGQLDLSASYTLARVPSKPQITLNVSNLTNKAITSYFGLDNMVDKYYEPGRTITLGIRGTF
jgi:TonB-dependent receptor